MTQPPTVLTVMTDQHAPKMPEYACDAIIDTDNLDALATGGGLPEPDGVDGVHWSDYRRCVDSEPPRSSDSRSFMTYGNRAWHGVTVDGGVSSATRSMRESRWNYVAVRRSDPLLYDLENDPLDTSNLPASGEYARALSADACGRVEDSAWDATDQQIELNHERALEYPSGENTTTPNQYMLPDGRILDTESELHRARWLPTPPDLRAADPANARIVRR